MGERMRILFADGSTGNPGTKSGTELITLLRELSTEQNMTMVMVTHDPAAAEKRDRIVHMEDGAVTEMC